MRFSSETRFPHPVLSIQTGDFTSGYFDVDFTVHESPKTGSLALEYASTLTEMGIVSLIESGAASVGCFIKCQDTYYSDLKTFSWPKGSADFPPGVLLNRVSLRPLVWLNTDIHDWDPGTIHVEFSPPVSLKNGDIIAIGEESIISVGQAKLAPIESIFEFDKSDQMPEGKLQIELDSDRIKILAAEVTYESILLLREQARGAPVVMNSVYMPAVMEVLDALRDSSEQYQGQRWYTPFMARCDSKGIDPATGSSILDSAQALLESPIQSLKKLHQED